MRYAGALMLIVGAIALAGCGPSSQQPCGWPAKYRPLRYDHVVWVWLENRDYTQVIGNSQMPYLNRLAGGCGLATNYRAVAHPSLPNYVAATSGSTYGITDDAGPSSHRLAGPSIFTQVGARTLAESMPKNCYRSNYGSYAVRHNPETYFTWDTDCGVNNVPLTGSSSFSAPFTFVAPNLCHDGHDCALSVADQWLRYFVPMVVDSPLYRAWRTMLVISFDENGGQPGNRVATVVIAPTIPAGRRDATPYTHYSLLATAEDNFGVPRLWNAAKATNMRRGMGF